MITIARYVNIDSGMMLTTEHEDGKLKGLIGKTIKVEMCEFDTVQINNQWYTIVGTYGALSQIELIDEDMMEHVESLDAVKEGHYSMEDEIIDAIEFDDLWDNREAHRELYKKFNFRRVE